MGGLGPGQSDKKKLFFSSQLILQNSNGQFQRNLSFFKVRCPIFSRVRSNCLFPIEIHITCDFPGGGGGVRTPCPLPSRSALVLA